MAEPRTQGRDGVSLSQRRAVRRAPVAALDRALESAESAVLSWPRRLLLRVRPTAALRASDRPGLAAAEARGLVLLLRKPRAPLFVLGTILVTYIVVFGTLTYRQQSNFGTFGFDTGIFDQGIWLLSRFKAPFDTIMGLNYFAQNVNVVTLLFVPAYWLGAGPHFLFVVQTVWIAAGAVPVWLLARDRLGNGWLPIGLAGAYLLYPSTEWINEWQFRPDALIIAPLMFAYWFASRRRWRWFWVATSLALSCKEDAGLAVFALGIVLWARFRERAWGLLTAGAGAAWFFICTKLIIPLSNGGGQPFYFTLFPDYGNSLFAILKNLIIHPMRWVTQMSSAKNLTYYGQLFYPVALVALLDPLVLLVGIPQLMVNSISAQGYTNVARFYYSSVIVAAVFLATVEGCARQGRTAGGRRFMVGLVCAVALASNVAWSISPISVQFHNGTWAQPSPVDKALTAAVQKVPPQASVSATYNIDAHMTHRAGIYEFPNPWIPSNWGLGINNRLVDPNTVDWMVIDTSVAADDAPLYEDLMRRQFRTVFDQDGVLVLHRVKPGAPNDHRWP